MEKQKQTILFGLDDRPPIGTALFVGLQHLLAVFGGIVTAPLIIASQMNLSVQDTSYLVTSALVVSGFATLVQVSRFGPVGSGMLSVQGTSFAFIGPLLYVYDQQIDHREPAEILGLIFGACAVCSILMMILSQFLRRLNKIITSNVAGATIILLGITLVWTTLRSIWLLYLESSSKGDSGWKILLLAVTAFLVIVVLSRSSSPYIRMSSIVLGLLVGLAIAFGLGSVDFSVFSELDAFFFPEFWRYEIGLDLSIILILLPVFIISVTESIGDLTATANLSGLKLGDTAFWKRIQGGVLADSINSFGAALFCTFPNTTFSQNNGVIRITGVCSRHVGLIVALLLVAVGLFPIIGGVFQILPKPVLYGATLLMFIMVGVSGYYVIVSKHVTTRDWILVLTAIVGGLSLSFVGPELTFLPQDVINIISFPVSSGAFIAMILELIIPKHVTKESP